MPREWIYQKPDDDIGLDGRVTLGTRSATGGFEFAVQVKTSKRWESSDGSIAVRDVKVDSLLFWGSRLYPTMLVL